MIEHISNCSSYGITNWSERRANIRASCRSPGSAGACGTSVASQWELVWGCQRNFRRLSGWTRQSDKKSGWRRAGILVGLWGRCPRCLLSDVRSRCGSCAWCPVHPIATHLDCIHPIGTIWSWVMSPHGKRHLWHWIYTCREVLSSAHHGYPLQHGKLPLHSPRIYQACRRRAARHAYDKKSDSIFGYQKPRLLLYLMPSKGALSIYTIP